MPQISFSCPVCGQSYENISDVEYGQTVECAICSSVFITSPAGQPQTVIRRGADTGNAPAPAAPPAPAPENVPPAATPSESSGKIVISFDDTPSDSAARPPVERKLSPRQRRLIADSQMMHERFSAFPYIKLIEADGNPPERYVVEYFLRGIDHIENGQIVYRNNHKVEIKLPGTYPRTQPVCRMLTPIFHPNIEPAVICIGDHWTAGERLCDLVVRIGEMITYQSYNVKSPLDGEAAMWADLNNSLLPVDNTDLMPPEN